METELNPLVSVVMPVHDAESYLQESIGSVLNQSIASLELIAVDDASSDRSLSIIDEIASVDARVVRIALRDNRGAALARNRALASARGRYVAFLDSDDYWEPDKLEKQIKEMEITGLPICTCGYRMQFEDSNGHGNEKIFHVRNRITYDDLLRTNYFSCSTLVLKRSLVPENMFDPTLMHEDYGAWLGLLKNGQEACGIDEPLAIYRIRNGSRSHDKVSAALGRWVTLERCTDEPLLKRTVLFVQYALAGFKKYGFRNE